MQAYLIYLAMTFASLAIGSAVDSVVMSFQGHLLHMTWLGLLLAGYYRGRKKDSE